MNNELVAIEGKLTSERKAKVFMMRGHVAQMVKALTNYQLDAMNEIRCASVILSGQQQGPTDYSLEKIRGSMKNISEQRAIWQMDIIQRYDEWRKETPPQTADLTWETTVYCTSASEAAERNNCTTATVMAHLRKGLDIYARLQGWIKNTE
jgi:hypothetical protein